MCPSLLQILAIYDRFGRLLYGDPSSPVDVLEYVVFESHITDEYGRWRIHGKVIPPWARGDVAASQKTRRLPPVAATPSTTDEPKSVAPVDEEGAPTPAP